MADERRDDEEFTALRQAYEADLERLGARLAEERRGCMPLTRVQDLARAGEASATASEREHLTSCRRCRSLVDRLLQAEVRARKRRWTWNRRNLSLLLCGLAAAIAFAVGLQLLLRPTQPPQLIADSYLSSSHLRESRGELAGQTFRNGERAYVHVTFAQSAWTVAARLDAGGRLFLASDVAVQGPEEYRLFAIDLGEETGLETILVLASSTPRTQKDFERVIRRAIEQADPSAGASRKGHEELRDAVVVKLREQASLDVRAETFLHLGR
jgi:hypothetical protein